MADVLGTPTREVYWNIQGIWVMYALLFPTALIFVYGLGRRVERWLMGKPQVRWDRPWLRLRLFLRDALAQGQVLRERYAGFAHLSFSWGFAILFVATVVIMIDEDLRIPIMQGPFYLYFQSLTVDLFGLAAIVGVTLALVQRYGLRPPRLTHGVLSDGVLLAGFLLILIQGYLIEGLRIVATQDPWGAWSPVGYLTGRLLEASGARDLPSQLALHRFLWWFHLVTAFSWLAYVPYSKLMHLFVAPAAILFRNLEPRGALRPIDLETAPRLGVRDLPDFGWKDLLDLDACTECGRCQEVCPAHAAGKPLNPKQLILDLQRQMRGLTAEQAAVPLTTGLAPGLLVAASATGGATATAEAPPEFPGLEIVGHSIDPETIWSCTTCHACVEVCPVEIEHVSKIVDLRRYQVMEEAAIDETPQQALQGIEDRAHPFRGTQAGRTDWYRDLPYVKEIAETGPVDYLFWVGCAVSLNERNQSTARALARILHAAGLEFAVLGEEESCTGDPARRMGNEYLFETMARRNIETLARHQVKRIVTTCPHCYNTFKNEYGAFGGHYEVIHHSELIERLLAEGRITLSKPLDRARITFHDPCYLGRCNGVYDAPRAVVGAVAGEPVEMERSRQESFCCGAGGGRYFMDDRPGQRVNVERSRQALATGAEVVGTACPFCMLMMEDGVRTAAQEVGRPEAPPVKDIAELVAEALAEG
ncbi:heterodisulfide reductase-related iron-sulfur binding cluster [Limnochorda pilosa]|uniref:4Fe-4S ferredoxin-type domain-containing protein n=1 Tax=Limnochorda pilosa TaxID=1555112 RepID=A0A0K2SG58_LIMPI|nr:heterodisulfide reductase-related iron-sulfur binding cluster [Limnochorda pilosa]BAS26086.1 hypothetical protein LIP_0229 [Limnochorda pilosa]